MGDGQEEEEAEDDDEDEDTNETGGHMDVKATKHDGVQFVGLTT